jgi:arylsulfatase A-like enzyme
MTRVSPRPGLIASLLVACALSAACASAAPATASRPDKPNIVLVYADDLGCGGVSSHGATRIQTKHIDRLAAQGLRFTRAHSTSATCTPARYGMLTGEYPWRKPGTGVLPADAGLIIEPGRTTLASVMQKAGDATGVVCQWHLGLGTSGGPDWSGEILEFDWSVGEIARALDRVGLGKNTLLIVTSDNGRSWTTGIETTRWRN